MIATRVRSTTSKSITKPIQACFTVSIVYLLTDAPPRGGEPTTQLAPMTLVICKEMQEIGAGGMLPIHDGDKDEKRYKKENEKTDPGLLCCNHWRVSYSLCEGLTEDEKETVQFMFVVYTILDLISIGSGSSPTKYPSHAKHYKLRTWECPHPCFLQATSGAVECPSVLPNHTNLDKPQTFRDHTEASTTRRLAAKNE